MYRCVLRCTDVVFYIIDDKNELLGVKAEFILISDTSTTDYFNGKSGLKVSMDTVDFQSPQHRKPLTKLDSIDIVDCKCINCIANCSAVLTFVALFSRQKIISRNL